MKKSNDRRIRYTRYALQNALIACMQQKPFNRITVREICETADINRSTFYMHYKDIYELLDDRGSFTEIIRTSDRGQFSVNISKPGVTKGQHWHHTKNEKFVVVSGHGLIQLRKIGTEEVVSFEVSGGRMEVVEMIPGYTHNIVNLSETEDLVTFMWCNECFDPARPDTYFEKV